MVSDSTAKPLPSWSRCSLEPRASRAATARPRHRTAASLLLVALALFGCGRKQAPEERGSAPPPEPSGRPGVCAGAARRSTDAETAAVFPARSGTYCIDPDGEVRAYGQAAKGSLDQVCTELFDGECEVYKSYGLERVVTLRYVDGAGSPGSVTVTLSRFASVDGAYGFFTKRVVADGDPLEVAPARLDAGGAGALGTGIAYVWRGRHVAELAYSNPQEAPAALAATSQRVLPELGRALGKALPGDLTPLPAVAALPAEHLLPLGVRYETRDLLGVAGLGPGAVGYYRNGDKRWRVLSMVRADAEAAQDVLLTVKKSPGARTVERDGVKLLRLALRSSDQAPEVEWLFRANAGRVLVVGDEELVPVAPGDAGAQRSRLTLDEKVALLARLSTPAGG